MKRAISIILAIFMIAAMLPTAVFAQNTTTSAGITITYDISSRFGKWSNQTVQFAEFTYESNKGLWEYYGNTKGLETIDISTTLNWSGAGGSMQMNSGWWAIKVVVPKSGLYTPSVQVSKYTAAALLNLYLVKNAAPLSDSDFTEENLIGSIDLYDSTYSSSPSALAYETLSSRYIEAGEYYLVYSNGGRTSPKGTPWVFFGNLTLDGAGTDTLLSGITLPDTLKGVKGMTEELSAELYLNDGNAAEGEYTVTYESSDTAVAAVDAESGVVTCNDAGSATITAYVTNEADVVLKAETALTVTDGAKIKYDVTKHICDDLGYYNTTGGSLTNLTETLTKGAYSYYGGSTDWDANKIKYYKNLQLMGNGVSVAFEINVPEAGVYNLVTDVMAKPDTARCNADMQVYVSETGVDVSALPAEDLVGTYNVYTFGKENVISEGIRIAQCEFDEAGKYVITFKLGSKLDATVSGTQYSYVGSFYLIGGMKTALMGGELTTTADSINIDEGETATASALGYLSTDYSDAVFTYSSKNESVATVDAESGVVTPVSEGTATIVATSTNTEVANVLTKAIKVTVNKPGEVVEDTMISVSVLSETGGTVSVEGADNVVDEVLLGTKITATATPDEDYEFAYWRNASGKWLSSNAKESFVINTNTSIIAVYDKKVKEDDTTVPVYFYNGNGEILGSVDAEIGKVFSDVKIDNPELTGYVFDSWSIADDFVINTLTRAVALYADGTTTYTVSVGDEAVASGKKYGSTVTVESTADDFVCWKLGENVMSYDKAFTFDIYGDIELTEVTGEAVDAEPLVVLDVVDGEYFLTYDAPAGYTKIEAGILFGQGATPEIDGFHAKAAEKTGSGQFTAKPYDSTDTIARGYMIFKDADNNIRVVYAD